MNNTSILIVLALFLSLGGLASAQNALTSNSAKITITNGSSLRVNGGTHLLSGSEFKNNGSFSSTGKLTTDQTMVAPSLGTLTFDGTSIQTIDGSGIFLAKDVVINNPGGLLLNRPLKVDGNIVLTTGIINTSSSLSPLILTENATVNGASDNSHVYGYVQKEGVGLFNYPVGSGSKYQPIVIDLNANSTGFQVKYFSGDAGSAMFATTGASDVPLQNYNKQEYWDLNPIGTAAGRVTIFWDETNNASITTSENLNVFKVAHKTSSGWQNEGSSHVTGIIGNGSVTSENISNWSPFTLGVISETALPVTLVDFRARFIENKIMVEWHTTQEENASYFEVEKSTDARHFKTIGKVSAAGNSASLLCYSHIDNSLSASGGIIYYRLRSVDADGSFSYSRAVSVKIPDNGVMSSVYPNPVLKKEMLTVESSTTADQITVYNVLGRKSLAPIRRLSARKIEINTSALSEGIYLIRLDMADKTVYHRLIVQ